MTEMVLGEKQPLVPRHFGVELIKLAQDLGALKKLLLHPERHGLAEGLEAARRKGEIGLQQPLELEERLVVEGDEIDLGGPSAGELETGANRVVREARIVLFAGEALFLRRRNDATVLEKRRRAIV